MDQPQPSPGRIVSYTLSVQDADRINGTHSLKHNTASAGEAYPAIIVRVFQPAGPAPLANLQVLYDGEGTLWVTSRMEGPGHGQWRWPARV